MFFKKKQNLTNPSSVQSLKTANSADEAVQYMGNAPATAYTKAKESFFELFGSYQVDKARYFSIIVLLGATTLGLITVIVSIAPLKEVQPWVVRVSDSGAVSVDTSVAKRVNNYKPGSPEVSYFLKKWVESTLRIDPYLLKEDRSESYISTRGKAQAEFRDFLVKDKPFERVKADPTFTRTIDFNTITPNSNGIGFVRIQTNERPGTGAVTKKNLLLTIHYEIDAPEDEIELLRNPLGFYVTHFDVQEELLNR